MKLSFKLLVLLLISLILIVVCYTWRSGHPLGNPLNAKTEGGVRRVWTHLPKGWRHLALYKGFFETLFSVSRMPLHGAGQTIILVEDKLVDLSSLQKFDSRFHLPRLAFATHIKSTEKHPYIEFLNRRQKPTTSGFEATMDAELVHMVVPNANIVVVYRARTSFLTSGFLRYLESLHPSSVSMSFYTSGYVGMDYLRLNAIQGIQNDVRSLRFPIFVCSGDNGAAMSYPSGLPGIISVGGTNLITNHQPLSQTYQSGNATSTGGYDAWTFLKPSWQVGNNSWWRGFPVLSFVENSYWIRWQHAWTLGAGTSTSTPIMAAIWALANERHIHLYGTPIPGQPLKDIVWMWHHYPADFIQARYGSNNGHQVHPGWNAVTGIGSPRLPNFIFDLGRSFPP